MALHCCLSFSSMIFHVLPIRLIKRPLVIWNEYRLHAIVFSVRSLSVYIVGHCWPFENANYNGLFNLALVFAHHLVVDEITKRYGPGDDK